MKVLDTAVLPISALKSYPGNPRRHDLPTITRSLERNGQYRAIVVRKKGMQILAGHGTVEAARDELGWTEIRCELIDCTPNEAKRIVLVDNRSSDVGLYDDAALAALLQDFRQDTDLIGTGYDRSDLDSLLAYLNPGGDPATGKPPTQQPYGLGQADLFRFILNYDQRTYERMIARLDELLASLEVESYSDVVERLVLREAA